MLQLGKIKVAKEKFYGAKISIKINADNIVISKLVETNNDSKYLCEYLGDFIRSLVLILPKTSGHAKTFKIKDKNVLMSFFIDDENLLEKFKSIWTKIEDLKNIEMHVLPVYNDRYIKSKIRTSGNKDYPNFHGLYMIINIDLKDAVILTTCVVKDNDKFYPQLFLEEALILQSWFELVKVKLEKLVEGNES